MGAKKKSADDELDDTCEKFYAAYTKTCKQMEIPKIKGIEEMYKELYIENHQMLTKVS
jgi:hypothetical protein